MSVLLTVLVILQLATFFLLIIALVFLRRAINEIKGVFTPSVHASVRRSIDDV